MGKLAGKHIGVLNGHCGALSKEGQHPMGGVAEQRDTLLAPRRERIAVEQTPSEAVAGMFEKRAQTRVHAGERRCEFGGLGPHRPGFLDPSWSLAYRDHVHKFSAAN